jgi:hypothetical protein
VRTGDVVVSDGVPKTKSMATPEKGLAGTRAMVAGTSAVKVAGAGDAMGAGKGVVVGTVFGTIGVVSTAERGWGARATAEGSSSATGTESLIGTAAKSAMAAGVTDGGGEDGGEFGADGGVVSVGWRVSHPAGRCGSRG